LSCEGSFVVMAKLLILGQVSGIESLQYEIQPLHACSHQALDNRMSKELPKVVNIIPQKCCQGQIE
jgi:hypothetical protein